MNLLVVEDDADAREMFALVLEIGGHTVRTAKDGAEAVAVVEAFVPEVPLRRIRIQWQAG